MIHSAILTPDWWQTDRHNVIAYTLLALCYADIKKHLDTYRSTCNYALSIYDNFSLNVQYYNIN